MMAKFQDTLLNDENRACYGLREVTYANNMKAIAYLLITDTLYRRVDPHVRNRFI